MIKEAVEVVEVLENKVKIKFQKTEMCSRCHTDTLCGKGRESLIIGNCGFSLKKGDKIEIAIDEKKTLLASLLIFLVPAFIFLISLVSFRNKGEVGSFFLALGVVCVYYIFFKVILRKQGKKFAVKITQKIE